MKSVFKYLGLVVLFGFSGSSLFAQTAPDVELRLNTPIPLSDGVKLSGNLFFPSEVLKKGEKFPTILIISPYHATDLHPYGRQFAEMGFIFVSVDSRGKSNSEGEFVHHLNEGRDGNDVVDWISKQPWSNGSVALFGASYTGGNQWSIFKHRHPALKTMIPIATGFPGMDYPSYKGVFTPYVFNWSMIVASSRAANMKFREDKAFTHKLYNDFYYNFRSMLDLDWIHTGGEHAGYRQWVDHTMFDSFWAETVPSDAELAQMDIPVLTVGGYFDGVQPGTIHNYKRYEQFGKNKKGNYLVMGPWEHGILNPGQKSGGLDFGPRAAIKMRELQRDWYTWVMLDGEKPAFLKDRVTYFVAGPNDWRSVGSLDEVGPEKHTLFLSADTNPLQVGVAGQLKSEKGSKLSHSTYVYDPLDTYPGSKDPLTFLLAPKDNYLLSDEFVTDPKVTRLIYDSAPFQNPTTISGNIRMNAWIKLNVKDTDFRVLFYEVEASGRHILLANDQLRARYRKSLELAKAELVKPGEVTNYQFESTFFSRQLAAGSKLRVVFSPVNSPDWEKNYNTGGNTLTDTAKDAVRATVELYHSKKYPSYIEYGVDR